MMHTTSPTLAKSVHEQEKMQLLYRISKAMAAVKDGRELLKIIVSETQPVFGFYDIGLSVLDKSGAFYVDWSIFYAEINPSEANIAQRKVHNYKIPADEPLFKYVFARAEGEKRPFISNLTTEFAAEFGNFPQLPIEMEYGFKQFLVTTLTFGGETFGIFNFNSQHENHFDNCDFDLFQAIADLVAVAVANIVANEEILEREKEKTILLSLSEHISTIRNRNELFKVIAEKIRPLFNYFDCSLYVKDKSEGKLKLWFNNFHNSPKTKPIIEKLKEGQPLDGEVAKLTLLDSPPFVLQRETMLAAGKDAGAEYIRSSSIEECMIGPLKAGNEVVGCFNITSLNKGYFTENHILLYKSVCEQLGIAVANILANEEILEREKEKELMYKIASAVANISDRVSLMKFIFKEIKSIFHFYDVGLGVLDKESENALDWAVHTPEIDPSLVNYELHKNNLQSVPYKNSLLEKIIQEAEVAGYPVIFKFNAQVILDNPDIKELLEIEIKHGYKEGLFTYLKCGNKIIGTFNINSKRDNHFKPAQFHLFQAVADQIAIAVNNIVANEEILAQKKEIEVLNIQLQAQNEYLIEEVEEVYNFEEMIGQNPTFQEVCNNIGLVSKTDSSVLILGETGTGKELVARAIHNLSPRHKKALIKINCAALPAHLIESELFGHERGAFTGAIERRVGKFELAHQSTLFLDEIGELPLELQAKLLRALQEKEIERLGSNKIIQCDVRIIAATNRDLLKAVQQGHFRQDLYYRLHVFPILLPPLRERKEDIPLLATHFLKRYAKKNGKSIQGFHNNAMEEMMTYQWHGNVRELEHVIERAVIMSKTKWISDLQLPRTARTVTHHNPQDFIIKTFHEQERDYLLEVLQRCNGKVKGTGGAAELLDLPPTTLISKMQKLGIKRKYQAEQEGDEK